MKYEKCIPNQRKYQILKFSDCHSKQDLIDFCGGDYINQTIINGMGFTASISYIIGTNVGDYHFGPGTVAILDNFGNFAIISEDAFNMLFNK